MLLRCGIPAAGRVSAIARSARRKTTSWLDGSGLTAISYGRTASALYEAAEGMEHPPEVVLLNRIWPFSEELVRVLARRKHILFFEEAVRSGSIAEHLLSALVQAGFDGKYEMVTLPDGFIRQCSVPWHWTGTACLSQRSGKGCRQLPAFRHSRRKAGGKMARRLDAAMAAMGLVPSREQAARLIRAGQVTVNGKVASRPSTQLQEDDQVEITGGQLPFVSRGGLKLQRALEVFPVSLNGCICADIGASTGGFTDCMLQHGAAKIMQLDVGTGQLHPSLLENPQVVNMEKTNIRDLPPDALEPLDFVSTDVSFISLRLVLPVICRLLKQAGQAVVLVKPQFEAGRGNVGKKGVVRDPKIHLQVLRDVARYAAESGLGVTGADYSPIRGPEGNIEYLYLLKKDQTASVGDHDLQQLVTAAHQALGKQG